MKLLINNKIVLIDDEDYVKVKDFVWYITGNRVHAIINKKTIYLHSLILNTNSLIDHIDRNGYNNQKSNLRLATKSQNAMNSKLRIDRLDSNIGYNIENCVPCCKQCNIMKNVWSEKDFLNKIKEIYEFKYPEFKGR